MPVQVCKFHINGGCQKGDDCPHLHVDLAAAPRVRQNWIAERYAQPTICFMSTTVAVIGHALQMPVTQ